MTYGPDIDFLRRLRAMVDDELGRLEAQAPPAPAVVHIIDHSGIESVSDVYDRHADAVRLHPPSMLRWASGWFCPQGDKYAVEVKPGGSILGVPVVCYADIEHGGLCEDPMTWNRIPA